jgi:SWI/SNF-related matrix-associated actin-dependent regulator of chromatin subfamily A3
MARRRTPRWSTTPTWSATEWLDLLLPFHITYQNMMAVRNALMELAAKASDHLQKDHIQKFTLQPKTVPHIQLSLPDGDQFGILRHDMTDALTPLLKQSPPFQLEAVAGTTRLLEQIGLATKPNEAIVQVNINIYGPRDRAAAVGDDLSNRKQWLQKPDFFKPQYPYNNPQALHFPELENQLVQEEIRQDVSTTAKPRAEEERVQKLVAQVHQALSRASELESITMAGDQRLKTNLLE